MSNDNDQAIDLADRGLLSMAYAYALDAVGVDERVELEKRLQDAQPQLRRTFETAVAEVRETMATVASLVATTPPPALRPRILEAISDSAVSDNAVVDDAVPDSQRAVSRRSRWKILVAAAAVAIGVTAVPVVLSHGGAGDGIEAVLVARDSRTTTSSIIGGGAATVTVSPAQNAAVVRFDDVAPPAPGTTYQLWLFVGPPRPAGTVTAADLAQDNRRRIENVSGATAFAVTVERAGGSTTPTRNPIVTVALD